MIRIVQVGKKKNNQTVAIVETPGIGRAKDRKFLLMLDDGFKSIQLNLNKEELQELNENIAQTIAMEINDESKNKS
jgi:ribosomal protein S13